MKCSVYIGNKAIATEVRFANTFISRMIGLLSKRQQDDNCGIILTPCSQVHTFFMKFQIDAVFLSEDNEILHIESLAPGKVSKFVRCSKRILELNTGVAGAYDLKPGMVLNITKNLERQLKMEER